MRPLPHAALRSALHDAKEWKTCLHPEASPDACSKIIGAHTVQRARTLERLVDRSRHVRTFYPFTPADELGNPALHRRGWREASTFTGFCSKHDAATFQSIENDDEEPTTESAFLFSYRALCHELYQKLTVQQAIQSITDLADRGLSPVEQRAVRHTHAIASAGRDKAIYYLQRAKAFADRELLNRIYSAWQFRVLRFEGDLCLATSGTPTPNRDLSGASLQILHDPTSPVQHMHVSVASFRSTEVLVVIGWRREHGAPERLVHSLLSLRRELLGSYIAQYVFAHLENVYFAESWWERLSRNQQTHIQSLAANTNPYYFVPDYVDDILVPWKLPRVVEI